MVKAGRGRRRRPACYCEPILKGKAGPVSENKEVGGSTIGEREVFIPAGVHPHFRRVRHRLGQRMALSLHHRQIRRSGICAGLSGVPADPGPAHYGHGVFCGPGQPEVGGAELQHSGAQGRQVAPLPLWRHGGQLSAHDVLYHGGRLDVLLCLQNVPGRVQRPGRGGGGDGFLRYAGPAGAYDRMDAGRHLPGIWDLLPGAAKRCGAHHQGDDGLSAAPDAGPGGSQRYAAGGCGGPQVLPSARFP